MRCRNVSYSCRSLRTSRRSFLAFWTSLSSSSKIRLRDRFPFDLMIALRPFLSRRRSFFNVVDNAMRLFSKS
jgi:hypothetical protein